MAEDVAQGAGDRAPRGRSAAFAVASGIFLSRIAGLVRERVFAHYLGASDAAGAFKAALRIPNLLVNLFGEGVLSASFIPVYSRLHSQGREREASQVASIVGSLLAVTMTVAVGLGMLGSRLLIDLIAPGFTGEVRELTITLVQIVFPGIGLLVMSAWCLGVLNSHRKFFLSYTAPVLWNAAQIGALLYFGARVLGGGWLAEVRLAEQVAWAMVVGSALQFLVQLPTAIRLMGGLRPSLNLALEPVRLVLRTFVPVVIGRGVVQLSAYIDQLLSSYLTAPIMADMAYAQILYTLPISLFGMGVSAAELPEMSRIAQGDTAPLRKRLEDGVKRLSFYVVPSVVAFLLLGDVVVATLYQSGRFGPEDTRVVWLILAGSTLGMLAATQARLCSSAFYAMHDTRTPLWFAMIRVAITAATGYAIALPLRNAFGWPYAWAAAGLTASAGIAGWVEFMLLRGALSRRIGAFSLGAGAMLRAWAAALVAGGVGFGLHRLLPLRHHPVASGVIVLGVYGVLYLLGAMALGLDEARALVRRLRR